MISFVAKTIGGQFIQIGSAIALAIFSKIIAELVLSLIKKRTNKQIPKTSRRSALVWILVIMVGLLGAIAAGSIYNVQFDKPFIEITSPKNNDSIKIAAVDSNMISGTYVVEGSSKNIVAREDLRICTLIHSANPIGTGWWMWPLPTVYDDGTWQGQAGAGGKDFPVAIGQEYDIVAVAASKEKIYAINHGVATLDIKDLDPKAISNRVHVSIGSIIYDKTAK